MQELRFVLIIVGALAIGALLFHGLWTSKKEGKSKFGDKPLGRIDVDKDEDEDAPQRAFAPEDDFEIIKKERKEPAFDDASIQSAPLIADPLIADPLTDSYASETVESVETSQAIEPNEEVLEPVFVSEPIIEEDGKIEDELVKPEEVEITFNEVDATEPALSASSSVAENNQEQEAEPEMEVIVLNVHCAGDEPFVGTNLFDSMQQNGLLYGEMDIFHRHADLSGTGKVLFSVANMMQPGTLEHSDPAEFTTKGISFFMTLPCFGEADQNFKLMLKTAQQIADDLGGNVLDDARNLMTPDRLAAYRKQIQEFNLAATS